MLIATLSMIMKLYQETKCPSADKYTKMWYIQWNITHSPKEWNLAISHEIDRARLCYGNEITSVRERKIPYDVNHMCNLKTKQINIGVLKNTHNNKRKTSHMELLNVEIKLRVVGKIWREMCSVGNGCWGIYVLLLSSEYDMEMMNH